MEKNNIILLGIICFVIAFIIYSSSSYLSNIANELYVASLVSGNPSYYKTQYEFWIYIRDYGTTIFASVGVILFIIGLSKTEKESIVDSKISEDDSKDENISEKEVNSNIDIIKTRYAKGIIP